MRTLVLTTTLVVLVMAYTSIAVAQNEGSSSLSGIDDVLKPDSSVGPGSPLPTLDLPFDSLDGQIGDDAAPDDEQDEFEDFQRGFSFSVTPLFTYFDQRSGDRQGRTGGGVQLDVSLPVDSSQNLIFHCGSNVTFDSGASNTAVSLDLSKLSDTQNFDNGNYQLLDPLAIGFGFDLFTLDDVPDGGDDRMKSQIKMAMGWALSDLMDTGLFFSWPISGRSGGVRSSNQFQGYWSGTLTSDLEMVAFFGGHDYPNTSYGGFDFSWIPYANEAVVAGCAIDNRQDMTFYVGFQHLFGTTWSQDTQQRGYYHRLFHHGLFRTLVPGDGEFFRETSAPFFSPPLPPSEDE